jgi:hypothetical protein
MYSLIWVFMYPFSTGCYFAGCFRNIWPDLQFTESNLIYAYNIFPNLKFLVLAK